MAIRIAVIGAGNHSEINHGPSLRDVAATRTIELAAVCDLVQERARQYAAQFGFARTHTDMHRMVREEKPDALVVVTPPSLTRAVVGDLLPYGIPLMIEKPPGVTPAETAQLKELADRHHCPVMVSFNRRFIPAMRKAREWMAGLGSDGAPRLVVARMLRSRRREKDFVTGTAIHLVDAVLSLLGAPTKIVHHRWATPHGGQSCDARIEFSGGAAATLVIAPDVGQNEETYEILGTDYSIVIDAERSRLRVDHGGRRVLEWQPSTDAGPHVVHGCVEETQALVRAVRGIEPWSPTLADGLVSVATAHALDAPTAG